MRRVKASSQTHRPSRPPSPESLTGRDGEGGPGIVQRTLDATLPPNFTGSADLGHKNAWIDVQTQADSLRRTPEGWTWTALRYKRSNSRPACQAVRIVLPVGP